ncbi:Malate synthase G GlcB [Mycobacterium tuberculosis]|nr:Malate synthase G GlcB [Mycobacterium tuberculosis]
MTDRVSVGNLRIARVLYDFVNNEALPGTDIDPDSFWAGVDKVVADLTPQNQALLNARDELQAQIDKWHRRRVIEPIDMDAYRQFLTEIGYLLSEPDDSPSPRPVSTLRSPRPPAPSWWCRCSTRGLL